MEKTDFELLRERMKAMFETGSSFKPAAYYDEALDTVRIVVADCSTTESAISAHLVLHERNYLKAGQARYVGFSIAGVRAFCKPHRLNGPIKLSEILKYMHFKEHDSRVRSAIAEVALPLLEDNNLDEVEFPA
ncbi:MAG: hypothetical protein HYS51_02145 [Candidatus Zambryskibacteria bacterium]|nr:hypothetical protein [Candidatus Zambryskibacteria bacterium]